MHRKTVLYVTDSIELVAVCKQALSELDVEVVSALFTNYQEVIRKKAPDLVIADFGEDATRELSDMEDALSNAGSIALLVLIEVEMLSGLRLPIRIPSDFIIKHATREEYILRMRNLIWPGEEATSADLLRIDSLTVNLATYQVSIADEPIDLTYLEYALFSFLITHPGRTYSRDALLRRVWGFDYYGGSRTVDVHVRRIRAKLGPEFAQRLETVRGVGYLWNG